VLVAIALLAVPATAATISEPGWSLTTAASGFNQPTTMQFLGDGDFFVGEKATGKLKRYDNGTVTEVLDLPVNSSSERGLLGVALHPDFDTTPSVYLYYSLADGGDGGTWLENRVSRFDWDGSTLTNETPLLSFERDSTQANGPNHDGGVLRFGPDGMLYGTTGDLNRDRAEQNNQSLAGTSADTGGIFRIRPDGTIPDGTLPGETANPFLGESNTAFHKWYAYGVRNSFGAAFDPETGELWDTENGPTQWDEINLVQAGFNSGWNAIMGPDSEDPQGLGDLVSFSGSQYSDPEFSWQDVVAPTAIQFLSGSGFGGGYDDAVLVTDVNTDQLYLFRLNGSRDGFDLSGDLADLVAENPSDADPLVVGSDFANPTDMRVGPDGAVYIVSLGGGAVYRIIPEPASLTVIALGGLALLNRRKCRA
jgi:glucose/arabinose dehydrogenase